jgi:hypothetical protein
MEALCCPLKSPFFFRKNLSFFFTSLCCWIFTLSSVAQQTLFQPQLFKDTGLKFTNTINESENQNVLAYEYFYNGGGVATGDFNNDGLPDLYFTSNMGQNKLFLNLGNMKFKDITKEANAKLEGKKGSWKTGATVADVNGDGLPDIYVCYSGKVEDEVRRNQLFINKGNLKFEEEAQKYGLDDKSYSTQAAFFDYDNDGDLDMFLLNHSTKKIDNLELAKYRNEIDELAGNKLYENKGNIFTDISQKAGIRQSPLTFGLGIAISDINQDGWQDIYVTNDYNEHDYLYINNHDGTFTDVSKKAFRHISQFSMGVDIADFNNDALPDIITLDMLPEDNRRQKLLQLQENYESFQLMLNQDLHKQYMRNMLQLNNGDGTFSEIGQLAGVSNTDWSWCPLFADFDNDGFKDLFITNGYFRDYTNKDFLRYWGDYKVKKAIDREPVLLMDLIGAMPSTTLTNYIFKNNGNLTFANVQNEWGITESGISSGAVYVDLDNDGDLDLVFSHINQPVAVYKNMTTETKSGNYLSLHLQYKKPNISAVGSKIYLYKGNKIQYQEVNPNRGYLSCLPVTVNFGLGKATEVDSIKIIWPDNSQQLVVNIAANQQLTIAYKDSHPLATSTTQAPIFVKANNIINYKTENVAVNDFKRQLLMQFMYSSTLPVIAKADVNKDGLEDLYISGDAQQPGKVFIQQKEGGFQENVVLSNNKKGNVAAATFFDANGDNFPDLYVARGGYHLFETGTSDLQDELYLNDGKGGFQFFPVGLPNVSASAKSCIRPCDFDKDGDIDVFVGGRVVPGKYPVAPQSYLLVNNGNGKFKVAEIPFDKIGMVTDAQWLDIDKDGRKDLILCGELMPVMVFMNSKEGFVDKTTQYFDGLKTGMWFSLSLSDIDNDGNEDIIAGNIGQNTQLKFTEKQPAELYYADFDGNGSIDPFLNFYIQGTSYPFVSRDELNEQMYAMRKKFTSYKDYSTATMQTIVGAEPLSKAGKLIATEARTVCFLNKNGKFNLIPLPVEAQFSVVTKIIATDFTNDGNTDLILLGNHSDNRLKIGSIDAGYGCLLKGDGKGNFEYINQSKSGICIAGDIKSSEIITIKGEKYIVAGVADGSLEFYRQNKK